MLTWEGWQCYNGKESVLRLYLYDLKGFDFKMENRIKLRQSEFVEAMELYESKSIYKSFGKIISIIIISLQVVIAYKVIPIEIGIVGQVLSLVIAYILADFINGLVHMYMDNNENYKSIAGPLIASFHLHHRTPMYKKNKVLIVYINEAGSKIWLAVFSIIITIVIYIFNVNAIVSHVILYFSILSCIAEVSHYLCHTSNSKVANFLRKSGILLRFEHHGNHHVDDNVNYAFLNGMTDKVINIIANRFYPGYKNTTDKHFEYYNGADTVNRQQS